MSSLSGTDGEYTLRVDARGLDTPVMNRMTKSADDPKFIVHFKPSEYTFYVTDSDLKFSQDVSDELTGIATIYTRMIDEYVDFIFSRALFQMRGEEGSYDHDFSPYLADLKTIQNNYQNPAVSNAAALAKFRFSREIDLSESEAVSLLNSLSPDSPLWMMHYTALTDAVNLVGLDESIDMLSEIAKKSPYEELRAEALYNIVRYHYKKENEEEWHASFFELVSNYPEHFRTSYAYKNFAPEQPVAEGKALPYHQFNALEDEEGI